MFSFDINHLGDVETNFGREEGIVHNTVVAQLERERPLDWGDWMYRQAIFRICSVAIYKLIIQHRKLLQQGGHTSVKGGKRQQVYVKKDIWTDPFLADKLEVLHHQQSVQLLILLC